MAEQDELAQLREDLTQQQAASMTLLGIVQESDKKLDEVTGAVRSIQAHEAIVDGRLDTIDARLNHQRVRIDNMHMDMQRSFAHVAQAQQQMEDRLNKRIDGLGDQLAQVIALLTRKEE